mmetsp:Transcript_29477/g.58751  ORF Transcript_29477/g.58751 Transcript_29477/m.58751 type:complete len:529 (-) Transcript_29477:26-1612(-)
MAQQTYDYYQKWDKYNVEGEEVKIDEEAKVEERDKKLQKLEDLQSNVESTALTSLLADSESYESKSAVEEFRKARKGRGGRAKRKEKKEPALEQVEPPLSASASGDDVTETSAPEAEREKTDAAASSKALADNAKTRAGELKLALDSRELGKAQAKEGHYSKALEAFIAGMAHLDMYEDLLDVEEAEAEGEGEKKQEESAATNKESKKKKKKTPSSHAVCCGPDAQQVKEQQQLLKPDPLQPNKDNLCVSLRRDFNLNIGRSHLELDCVTEACEAFKYVLLVDPGNVSAWVARAECFRRMQLFILADLHLVKATDIDDIDRNAKAVKKMNDKDMILQKTQKILAGSEKGGEDEFMALAKAKSAKDILKRGVELYKEGNVIFREQFFNSACEKYKKASDYITIAEKILDVVLPGSIDSIRTASLLQVAACCLLRKREAGKAENACTTALKLGGFNITALLRRADARVELGKYEGASKDLRECERALLRKSAGKEMGDNQKSALENVKKRIERVEYIEAQVKGKTNPDLV